MSANINLLTPPAKSKCLEFLENCEEAGLRIRVTNTLRTPAEHAAIYAQGRQPLGEVNHLRGLAGFPPISAAQNGKVSWSRNSPHLRGVAWDIVVIDDHGKADWNSPDYAKAGKIAIDMGLTWGGSWKVVDAAHFQIPE